MKKSLALVLISISAALSSPNVALAANSCVDLFSAQEFETQSQLLSKSLVVQTSALVARANGASLKEVRAQLEKVSALQNKNVGPDRYWIKKSAQDQTLAGGGLFYSDIPGQRGFWLENFFASSTPQGKAAAEVIIKEAINHARTLGLEEVRVRHTDLISDSALASAFEKFGFRTYSSEGARDNLNRIRFDEKSDRSISYIYRRLQLLPQGSTSRDFMPAGPYAGERLDTRIRSLRLVTKIDVNNLSPLVLAQPLLIENVQHGEQFLNVAAIPNQVTRVILQRVPPKKPELSDIPHVRLRFDFENPVALLDPMTGAVVDHTSSLTISVGPQRREIDRINQQGAPENGLAAAYSLYSEKTLIDKIPAKGFQEIRQHELQIDALDRASAFAHAMDHGDRLGSHMQFDICWSNCSTQLFSILKSSLDHRVENAAEKQERTAYFQAQARFTSLIAEKRFWAGITKEIEIFQQEPGIAEKVAASLAEKQKK